MNPKNITIRFLSDADVPKIPSFFDGLSEASRGFYHPYEFNQEAVRRTAKEINNETCVHIGAFHQDADEENLVGHVWYIHNPNEEYPILGLGVADAFQNQGIGQALMQRIEQVAREHGETGIELTVYIKNHRARHVYTKHGYRIIGKTSDGRQFRMVRELTKPAVE